MTREEMAELLQIRDRMDALLKNSAGGDHPFPEVMRGETAGSGDKPLCDCGEPAVFKSGTSKTGKPWSAYFCAKRKDDLDNCGFKEWV